MSVDIHKWTESYPCKLKRRGMRLKGFGYQHLPKTSAIFPAQPVNAITADYLATIITSVMSLWRNSENQASCRNQSANLAIQHSTQDDNWRMYAATSAITGKLQPDIPQRQGQGFKVHSLCSPPPQPTFNVANLPGRPSEGRLNGLASEDFGTSIKSASNFSKDANYISAFDFVGQLHQACRSHLGCGDCKSVVVTSLPNRLQNDKKSLRITASAEGVYRQKFELNALPKLSHAIQLKLLSELHKSQINAITNLVVCVVTVRQLLLGAIIIHFQNSVNNFVQKRQDTIQKCTLRARVCANLEFASENTGLSTASSNMAANFNFNNFEMGEEGANDEMDMMGGDEGDLRRVPDFAGIVEEEDANVFEDYDEDEEDDDDMAGANGAEVHWGDRLVPLGDLQGGENPVNMLNDEFANRQFCDLSILIEPLIDEPPIPPVDDDWIQLDERIIAPGGDAANAA